MDFFFSWIKSCKLYLYFSNLWILISNKSWASKGQIWVCINIMCVRYVKLQFWCMWFLLFGQLFGLIEFSVSYNCFLLLARFLAPPICHNFLKEIIWVILKMYYLTFEALARNIEKEHTALSLSYVLSFLLRGPLWVIRLWLCFVREWFQLIMATTKKISRNLMLLKWRVKFLLIHQRLEGH